MPEVIIIPFLAFCVSAVVIWCLVLRFRKRELQHKERLAALEKGMPLPDLSEAPPGVAARPFLLKGMMWLFAGIAVMAFLGAISATTGHPRSVEERVERARNLKYIGATEEEIKQAENDTAPEDKLPLAVALLGLVPIGVGLAYLIYYRVESKHSLPPA